MAGAGGIAVNRTKYPLMWSSYSDWGDGEELYSDTSKVLGRETENFLVVQWFRTFTIVARVQSMVREQKSCKSHSHAAKKKRRRRRGTNKAE